MPRDLVKVLRVDPCMTVNPQVTSYTVTGETVTAQPRHVQFQTINDLKASICSRGKQLERWVWIGWKDGRFNAKEIVTVELDDSRFVHADQAAS
jgi:hypothetical protein